MLAPPFTLRTLSSWCPAAVRSAREDLDHRPLSSLETCTLVRRMLCSGFDWQHGACAGTIVQKGADPSSTHGVRVTRLVATKDVQFLRYVSLR